MHKIKMVLTGLFISFTMSAIARDIDGCALATDNSKVNTTLLDLSILGIDLAFGGNYASIPSTSCVVLKTPLQPCKICPNSLICLSVGALKDGYRATIITNCNLDDYSWPLGLGAGLFGFFIIRRRNKY